MKEDQMAKPTVDKDLCVGCALCTQVCPDVFEMDDEGKSKVIKEIIGDDLYDCVKEAVDSCPVSCITLEEA